MVKSWCSIPKVNRMCVCVFLCVLQHLLYKTIIIWWQTALIGSFTTHLTASILWQQASQILDKNEILSAVQGTACKAVHAPWNAYVHCTHCTLRWGLFRVRVIEARDWEVIKMSHSSAKTINQRNPYNVFIHRHCISTHMLHEYCKIVMVSHKKWIWNNSHAVVYALKTPLHFKFGEHWIITSPFLRYNRMLIYTCELPVQYWAGDARMGW